MTLDLQAEIREFRYNGASAPALADIALHVPAGEFVIVTGTAAAGKTTLCYCLTGVIPKSVSGIFDGKVRIGNQDLAELPLPRVGPLMGLVMQAPENQLFNVTVAEDVAFGPENLQLPLAEVRSRVQRSLEFTGCLHLAQRFSHLLSGGQSQRVVLSSVLAMEAGVFVFDQPAAELDPAGRRRIYENIARLNREAGKTVILVEDRLSDVVQFATRVILLHDGQVVRDEAPAQFFAHPEIFDSGVRVPAPVALYHALRDQGLELPQVPLTAEAATTLISEATPIRRTPGETAAPEPVSKPIGEPVVEITDLFHRYPAGVEALSGVSLTVRQAEFVAIVGENGAGKTTLAKHLIGLLRPTSGTVRVQGRDVRRVPVHQVAQWVGFLFQDPDLQIFNNSVREEVAYGLGLRRLPQPVISARTQAALERVGLAAHAEDHPYTLSRGQRQRLAVASVLALQPPILVVDEPSTGLDYSETLSMMALLEEYRQGGGTVLIITHDVEMAVRFAHRIVIMAHGRLAHDLPVHMAIAESGFLQDAAVFLPDLASITQTLGVPAHINEVGAAARWLIEGHWPLPGKEAALE
jgi:energy-coupling factor transport system ATP-binding protein